MSAVAETVRVRKVGTRKGRPEMFADGHVVEGVEVASPELGMPYSVRPHPDTDDDIFATSPVRALLTDRASGAVTLLTDNSMYAIEVVGR